MIMSGKYYPNNWKAIKDAPAEYFEPCTWEEFHDWKICAWEMPSSVACILRIEDRDTGKVTEHSYKNAKSAKKRLMKAINSGKHDVTICDHESIHLISLDNDDSID